LLGEKESEEMYTQDELESLEYLANQTGLVLHNIRLYEEVLNIKNYNEEILKNMTSGVITIAMNGKIEGYNAAAAKLICSDNISGNVRDVFSRSIEIQNMIELAIKNKKTIEAKEVVIECHNEEKSVSISINFIEAPKKSEMLLFVINDISPIKKLEKLVRQSEKLSSLGTMAAGMAHEIKNPLSSMKVLTQLMPKKFEDPVFRLKFQEIMPVEINRIDKIIGSMLGFVKASKPLLEKIMINDIVEEALSSIGYTIKKNKIKVSKHLEETPCLLADAQQILQVFLNLIQNAIQSMNEGGTLSIETKYLPPDTIQIKISDTGIGIPKDNLPKIFDPFFSQKYGGTGLGLTIVHGIIDAHNGTIEVSSIENTGTTFCINLPIRNENEN